VHQIHSFSGALPGEDPQERAIRVNGEGIALQPSAVNGQGRLEMRIQGAQVTLALQQVGHGIGHARVTRIER
jgi:hypothetical protein